ncbi:hypothetical protein GOBAR_AA38809 [Gossypium barbadense]|uniref:Uncharacterized protein n=1 Tax=Gossypium barbadense TaxID=3634 RepID=A0A2P5VST5_GOSBA|nr:hypothetical protein GOBAR_AA38809 [Gossypium barbadense]
MSASMNSSVYSPKATPNFGTLNCRSRPSSSKVISRYVGLMMLKNRSYSSAAQSMQRAIPKGRARRI